MHARGEGLRAGPGGRRRALRAASSHSRRRISDRSSSTCGSAAPRRRPACSSSRRRLSGTRCAASASARSRHSRARASSLRAAARAAPLAAPRRHGRDAETLTNPGGCPHSATGDMPGPHPSPLPAQARRGTHGQRVSGLCSAGLPPARAQAGRTAQRWVGAGGLGGRARAQRLQLGHDARQLVRARLQRLQLGQLGPALRQLHRARLRGAARGIVPRSTAADWRRCARAAARQRRAPAPTPGGLADRREDPGGRHGGTRGRPCAGTTYKAGMSRQEPRNA